MGSQKLLFNNKNILLHISERQGEEGAKKSSKWNGGLNELDGKGFPRREQRGVAEVSTIFFAEI